jgi:putative phosphoesterase
MRLIIASDIHGSSYYCGQLLECFDREKGDRIVLLGDILNHGPRNALPRDYDTKKVIAMLNARKQDIICIKGNCDGDVDQMVLEFPLLAEQGLIAIDGYAFTMAHGHKLSGATMPMMRDGDVLLYGHTHVPKAERKPVDENDPSKGTYLAINPGSVSIPKEDSWHGYMVYENGTFTMKDMEGNVKLEVRL